MSVRYSIDNLDLIPKLDVDTIYVGYDEKKYDKDNKSKNITYKSYVYPGVVVKEQKKFPQTQRIYLSEQDIKIALEMYHANVPLQMSHNNKVNNLFGQAFNVTLIKKNIDEITEKMKEFLDINDSDIREDYDEDEMDRYSKKSMANNDDEKIEYNFTDDKSKSFKKSMIKEFLDNHEDVKFLDDMTMDLIQKYWLQFFTKVELYRILFGVCPFHFNKVEVISKSYYSDKLDMKGSKKNKNSGADDFDNYLQLWENRNRNIMQPSNMDSSDMVNLVRDKIKMSQSGMEINQNAQTEKKKRKNKYKKKKENNDYYTHNVPVVPPIESGKIFFTFDPHTPNFKYFWEWNTPGASGVEPFMGWIVFEDVNYQGKLQSDILGFKNSYEEYMLARKEFFYNLKMERQPFYSVTRENKTSNTASQMFAGLNYNPILTDNVDINTITRNNDNGNYCLNKESESYFNHLNSNNKTDWEVDIERSKNTFGYDGYDYFDRENSFSKFKNNNGNLTDNEKMKQSKLKRKYRDIEDGRFLFLGENEKIQHLNREKYMSPKDFLDIQENFLKYGPYMGGDPHPALLGSSKTNTKYKHMENQTPSKTNFDYGFNLPSQPISSNKDFSNMIYERLKSLYNRIIKEVFEISYHQELSNLEKDFLKTYFDYFGPYLKKIKNKKIPSIHDFFEFKIIIPESKRNVDIQQIMALTKLGFYKSDDLYNMLTLSRATGGDPLKTQLKLALLRTDEKERKKDFELGCGKALLADMYKTPLELKLDNVDNPTLSDVINSKVILKNENDDNVGTKTKESVSTNKNKRKKPNKRKNSDNKTETNVDDKSNTDSQKKLKLA